MPSRIVPSSILIGSLNRNKIPEIIREFSGLPVNFVDPYQIATPELVVPDIDESGDTYFANALLKARAFAEWSSLPAIADDSGLEVDFLNGAPGVRSARLAPTDSERLVTLISMLAGVPAEKRTARFRTSLVYVDTVGEVQVTEGVFAGSLTEAPRGKSGWGYEPIFVPEGEVRTVAEMRDAGIDPDSHRRKAARAMREVLALCL